MEYEEIADRLCKISQEYEPREVLKACIKSLYVIPVYYEEGGNKYEYLLNSHEEEFIRSLWNKIDIAEKKAANV